MGCMPPCTICNSSPRRRAAVDRHLLAGEALRAVARRYHFSEDAVGRHRARHLERAMTAAIEKQDGERAQLAYGERLLAQIADLRNDALALQRAARGQRDLKTALRAIETRLRVLEVEAKLTGNIPPAPAPKSLTVNMAVTREEALQYARDLIELFGPAALPPGSPQANAQEPGKVPAGSTGKDHSENPAPRQPGHDHRHLHQDGGC